MSVDVERVEVVVATQRAHSTFLTGGFVDARYTPEGARYGKCECGHPCTNREWQRHVAEEVVAALDDAAGPKCPNCGESISEHDAEARKQCHDALSGFNRSDPLAGEARATR